MGGVHHHKHVKFGNVFHLLQVWRPLTKYEGLKNCTIFCNLKKTQININHTQQRGR